MRLTIDIDDKEIKDLITDTVSAPIADTLLKAVHAMIHTYEPRAVETASVTPAAVEVRAEEEPTEAPTDDEPHPATEEATEAPSEDIPAEEVRPLHTLTQLRRLLNTIWSNGDEATRTAVTKLVRGYTTDRSMSPQMVPADKIDLLYDNLKAL